MRTHPRRRLTRHFPIFFAGVVFLWLSYGVLSTHAQVDRSWRPSISDGFFNDGDWFNGNNWTPIPTSSPPPPQPPTATQSASVNNGPVANVQAPGAQAKFLILGGSNADIDNTLPPFSAGSGQVLVNGSIASLQLGQQATNPNAVSLDVVTGSLTVENGGTLETTNTRVGSFQTPTGGLGVAAQLAPTSPAFIDVTGAGSTWTEHGSVEIGANESAQVVIQDGASFTGSGIVTIDGLGELDVGGGSSVGTFSATRIVNNNLIDFDFTNTLTLAPPISGTGNIEKLGSGTLILTGNGTYTGSTIISAGTLQLGNGGTTGSVPGNVVDNGTLAFDRSNPVTFAGLISGTGAVTQNGTGTVTLAAANTYSGGTNFNAGILAVASDSNLGTGALRFNGGTLEALAVGGGITSAKAVTMAAAGGTFLADASTVSTLTGNISGTGSFTKAGQGKLILAATNTYSGGTNFNAGVLAVTTDSNLGTGSLTFNGGTLEALAAGGGIASNKAVTLNPLGGTFLADIGTASVLRGVISGAGSLTKDGAGKLSLTGTNTYVGGTTITAGTLQIGASSTAGSIVGNVTDNGTLAFDRSDSVTFGGVISGVGNLVQAGAGTLTLTGKNTYSGGTIVDSGTLVAGANNALGSGFVDVNDPSLLRVDSGVTITNFVRLNNGGSLDNAGSIQVTATTEGPAAAIMTSGGAAITNEAGAKISGLGGLIAIQSLTGVATVSNNGSISGVQGAQLNGGGTITNNAGGTITGTSGTAIVIGGSQAKFTNAGQISGNVQLNASSNMAQLFTGGKISGNLALNPSGTNQVILDGSGTQLLSQSVTGTISNAGELKKQGTGEWILDENITPPVDTLINSGILQVNAGETLQSPIVTIGSGAELRGFGTITGSVINNGLVTPGDAPGTLTINGNYTQSSSGTLNIQFASGSNGLLRVGGQALLGGTLRLTLVNGFVPPAAQRLTILTAAGGVNRTFSLVQQPTATTFTVFYDPKDVQVQVGQVPFQNGACDPNTRSVLTALQSVRNTATGDLATVIGVLNGLPINQLCPAGGQISPLPVPSLPTQVINSLDNASTEVDQRLWGLEQPFDPNHRWDIYVDGGGTFGRIKNIFDLPALDFDTGWTTPGGDYRFSPSLALGVYAGYAHSESRFSDHTHVSTDTPSAGTYGLWNPPFMGPFGLDVDFGGGYNDYSMKRPIKFGDPIDRTASSNPRSKYFKERLGTSYHKRFGKLNVEMLGSYEYASIESDRFYEHGAFSLDSRVGKYDVPSLRQRFGIHLVYDIPVTSKVTVTPDFRFTWVHEYLDGTRTVPVSLDSGAGPNFSISQPHGPRDEYISVIGFYAVFGELKGYLYWTSDFGSGIVTSNSVMGGVTLNF